jgi:hypothetical protein
MQIRSRLHIKIAELAMDQDSKLEQGLKEKFGSGKRFYWCMSNPKHCTLEELLLLSDVLKVSPINLYKTYEVGKNNIPQRVYQLLREHEQLQVEVLAAAMPMGAV